MVLLPDMVVMRMRHRLLCCVLLCGTHCGLVGGIYLQSKGVQVHAAAAARLPKNESDFHVGTLPSRTPALLRASNVNAPRNNTIVAPPRAAVQSQESSAAGSRRSLQAGNMSATPALVPTRQRHSLFDWYFCAYWGAVLIVFGMIVPVAQIVFARDGDGQDGMRALRAMMKSRSDLKEERDDHMELCETIWALNLVAAAGQVKFSNGWRVPVAFVAFISVMVGVLQILILWILVQSINLDTRPISEHWTVNCMKWCMVLVIAMSVCGDLEECKGIVLAIYKIDSKRLLVPRLLPAFVALWQYAISVYVVRAGVQVVLSFERSPDIVYSSLAVTFLTHIDNLAYNFLETALNLQVDVRISLGDMRPLPAAYSWAVMFGGFFPMLLAVFLAGRAFLLNEMLVVV